MFLIKQLATARHSTNWNVSYTTAGDGTAQHLLECFLYNSRRPHGTALTGMFLIQQQATARHNTYWNVSYTTQDSKKFAHSLGLLV
jgi:hypothetical protein